MNEKNNQVELKQSRIPNAGTGLFATKNINTSGKKQGEEEEDMASAQHHISIYRDGSG